MRERILGRNAPGPKNPEAVWTEPPESVHTACRLGRTGELLTVLPTLDRTNLSW